MSLALESTRWSTMPEEVRWCRGFVRMESSKESDKHLKKLGAALKKAIESRKKRKK
jgi:hypothetical protein